MNIVIIGEYSPPFENQRHRLPLPIAELGHFPTKAREAEVVCSGNTLLYFRYRVPKCKESESRRKKLLGAQ